MKIFSSIGYYAPKIYDYTARLAKASPYIVFGDAAHGGAKAASAVVKTADMSFIQYIKNMVKAGGKGIEKSIAVSKKAAGGSFIKAAMASIKELPKVIKTSMKWNTARALVAAKAAGKTGAAFKAARFWGGVKGFFKGVGKKMPLIGNIMLIAFELPNIFKATAEKGLGQGIIETIKAGTRLTVASIASAIGTVAAGPIGGIAGFIIGDWLASKVVGKSYTQKVEEENNKDMEAVERIQQMQEDGRLDKIAQQMQQAQAAQQTQQTQQPQAPQQTPTATYPNGYNPFGYGYNSPNSYDNDFMMKNVKF